VEVLGRTFEVEFDMGVFLRKTAYWLMGQRLGLGVL
jgi:hypothetical protein